MKIWVKLQSRPRLTNPIAIVGSPGLRSVGKIVLDKLVNSLKAELLAELYSSNFPVVYDIKPAYVAVPGFPGKAGVRVQEGKVKMPCVRFYFTKFPELVLVKGYHANFEGQYYVAGKVSDMLKKHKVNRMYVTAGYGLKGADVCCAATSLGLLDEMRKFKVDIGYEGPFIGFSGLVFGLGMMKGIEGICLFGRTQPMPKKPQYPDPEAAKKVLAKLDEMLNLNLPMSVRST